MFRRTLSALLVAASLSTGALVAAPAQAATDGGSCNLNVPARVTVNHLFITRGAIASGTCTTAAAEALWYTSPSGPKNLDDEAAYDDLGGFGFYFRGDGYYGRLAQLLIFGDSVVWGRNYFYPAYAGRGCDDEGRCKVTYTQNTPSTDMRLGTRSKIWGHRHKGSTVLTGRGKVYAPYRDGYAGRIFNGVFQTRPSSGGEWTTIRRVKTGYKGFSTISVPTARGKQYRFVTLSDRHWWTSLSRTIKR